MVILMTFVAPLHICGIASRSFISTSVIVTKGTNSVKYRDKSQQTVCTVVNTGADDYEVVAKEL